MRIKFLLSALVLLASIQTLEAKTLIVSDIDDTVKMTNVLGSTIKKVYAGVFGKRSFAGMTALYKSMVKEGDTIYYVSGSPKIITFSIKKFLKTNNFPQQENYILKGAKSGSTLDYKVNAIQKLIAQEKPDQVILLGDDTEHDPEVYSQISAEFPELVKGIYIRAIRNNNSTSAPSFFSPAEVAAREVLQGRLTVGDLALVTEGFIKEENNSGIYLKKRYCPKAGRPEIEELKTEFSDEDAIALLEKSQAKIIESCN